MVIPENLDLNRPTDELVAELVASGGFDQDEAAALLALWKDLPDGMLE